MGAVKRQLLSRMTLSIMVLRECQPAREEQMTRRSPIRHRCRMQTTMAIRGQRTMVIRGQRTMMISGMGWLIRAAGLLQKHMLTC